MEAWLDEFCATRSAVARNRAIEAGMPLAERLARRFDGRGEEATDLRQVAMVGLVHAVDRYDPSRANGFIPFAVATIVGELKRHFRDKTWALHVPRSVKEHSLLLRAATEAIASRNQPVTVAALASETGLSTERVLECLEGYQARMTVSLDAPVPSRSGEGDALLDMITRHDDSIDLAVDLASLAPAIERLPARDRLLLELRFVRELSQSEIGKELGVSQMQVSRLLRSVCERLRGELVEA